MRSRGTWDLVLASARWHCRFVADANFLGVGSQHWPKTSKWVVLN
jgi:hypothetical protein